MIYIISVISVGVIISNSKAEAFSGSGGGTSGDPYIITTCDELQDIVSDLSAYYILANNIDCYDTSSWDSGAGFTPIGISQGNAFSGTLDGRNNTISGLFIDRASTDNVGLFAHLTGTVKNLDISDVNITGRNYTGGAAGATYGATLTNINVQGTVTGNSIIGGFVGYEKEGSQISKCSFTGESTDVSSYGGGFAGFIFESSVADSYAIADYGGENVGGGFAARLSSDDVAASITNSYFVGSVRNDNYRGGFISDLTEFGAADVTVVNSFAVYTGSIDGITNNSTYPFSQATGTPSVTDFYFDADTAMQSNCTNSTDLTALGYTCTAINQDGLSPEYYVDTEAVAPLDSWDFTTIWENNGYYPELREGTLDQLPVSLGGAGSEGDPYLVSDCEELQDMDSISPSAGVYVELTGDIDCSMTNPDDEDFDGGGTWADGNGFVPIGETFGDFAGNFDGKNYTISGLYVDQGSYSGLFYGTDDYAEISNLNLTDVDINGSSDVGALVGSNYRSTIDNITISGDVYGSSDSVGGVTGYSYSSDMSNIHFSGTVTSTGDESGGITGYLDTSNLSYCSFSGEIESEYESGGLVGEIEDDDTTIDHCFSEGSIISDDDAVGGLIGEPEADGISVTNSYSTMHVEGDDYVGGLFGYLDNDMQVTNAYFNGTVISDGYAGLVVGYSGYDSIVENVYGTGTVNGDPANTGGFVSKADEDDSFSNSFWNKQTSGYELGCRIDASCEGLIGLTTAEMKNSNTFINADWNFQTIWAQNADVNDGFPCLQWQNGCVGYTNSAGQSDLDNDGIADNVEQAGPNNGDANNDGIADYNQVYVASYVNQVNSQYSVLEVDQTCFIRTAYSMNESENVVQDSGFDYPAGIMTFTMNCANEDGFIATINQYYYGVDASLAVRKYNPNTNAYFDIEANYGATKENVSIGGEQAVKVNYLITDGGDLDMDNSSNGNITDPAGLAMSNVGSPNTGYNLAD